VLPQSEKSVNSLVSFGSGGSHWVGRFYEGDVIGAFLSILGLIFAAVTVVGLLISILPFVSKTFRLLRKFETADK
tara:strand:+ start:300 stop:524 length:225 start_codon:yes stop_codon:yes gene_type:complete